MNMLVVILVVCLIFGFVSQPVDRFIKKKVPSKWVAIILQVIAYWIIFVVLYGIAALLGFGVWK